MKSVSAFLKALLVMKLPSSIPEHVAEDVTGKGGCMGILQQRVGPFAAWTATGSCEEAATRFVENKLNKRKPA